MQLSIIIPSVNDPALQKTVDDLNAKASGEIEVIVVFDGVPVREVSGAKTLGDGTWHGMRWAVNTGVETSVGEYIMKTDDHCMFGEGYDQILLSRIKDNWIVTPRRFWLDVKKWEIVDIGKRSVDYERLLISNPNKIEGQIWNSRAKERAHKKMDETMLFQGSCYVMSRKHWNWLGGLHEEGYGDFAQEALEICMKTWLGGGRVIVNKNTWYAHKHRSFGRLSKVTREDMDKGSRYARDFWINNRWKNRIHDLKWLFDRFNLKYE